MRGITARQLEVLQHLSRVEPGHALDFDQLLPLLSWAPTKEATQFTIRALVTRGLMAKGDLELRRGRKRVTYHITAEGARVLDPRGPAAASEPAKPVSAAPGKAMSLDELLGDLPPGSDLEVDVAPVEYLEE